MKTVRAALHSRVTIIRKRIARDIERRMNEYLCILHWRDATLSGCFAKQFNVSSKSEAQRYHVISTPTYTLQRNKNTSSHKDLYINVHNSFLPNAKSGNNLNVY